MQTTPSAMIAKQVRKRRADLGMNREDLAKRCADLGAPKLTVAAITNIETGRPDAAGKRRREVSMEELVILARALRTPPILLVFPLGTGELIELSPGTEAATWPALKWFSGEAAFPHWEERDEHGNLVAEVGDATDTEAWEQGAAPVQFYRVHERHLEEWQTSRQRAAYYRRIAERPELSEEGRAARLRDAEAEERTAQSMELLMWEKRRMFRQVGIEPPELPEALRDLDDETSSLYRELEAVHRQRTERDEFRTLRDERSEP